MAANLRLDRVSGAVVVRLTGNGPAAKAGLQLGDVIIGVDGFDVGDAHCGPLPADDAGHRQHEPARA